MDRPTRALTPEFKRDLQNGLLAPLLDLVLKDRDLLLEIRSGYIDLYFKGNGLLKVGAAHGTPSEYDVSTHEKFAVNLVRERMKTDADVQNLIEKIPRIKQEIATHKAHASEIEIEHFFIRINNREPGVNSEYFVIDRQGVYGPALDRFDSIGVCWPRASRRTSVKLDPCVMEVKFAMGAEIRHLADQLNKYYGVLSANFPAFVRDMQALLRDKIDLGLLGNDRRVQKLRTIDISDRIEDVRCLVVLAEQNPFSQRFDPQSLSLVPFQKIEIFRVGFGLWCCDAYRLQNGTWHRPAAFGQTI